MIDKNNEIWETFAQFQILIGSEGKSIGLDLFGTEQSSTIALSLTQSYYINELRTELKGLFVNDEIKRSC